jgi:signal transduction histidine kinase
MDESMPLNLVEQYRHMLQHTDIPLLLLNQDRIIIYANTALTKLINFSYEEELLNSHVQSILPFFTHASFENSFGKSIRSVNMGRIKSEEHITAVIKKKGIPIDVRVLISYYEYQQKLFCIMALIPIKEQSQRLLFVDNLIKENKVEFNPQSKMTEQKTDEILDNHEGVDLCRVFNTAGIMLILLNEKGYIRCMNQEARRLLKYDETEMEKPLHLQSVLNWCDLFHHTAKEDPIYSGLNFMERLERLTHLEKNRYREVTLVNKEGQSIQTLFTASFLNDIKGNSNGFVCVALDITERKKQEEQLMASLDKEKKLGDIKSYFVTIASHEFRTPLSTILSSAHLAGKYHTAEDQHKRDRHLRRIISAANTLNDILNDFLNAGKIEEGKISVKMSRMEVQELFNQILHDIKANARKGQVFVYEHEGKANFTSDASLIRNMLINLISNAIKYSPENSTIRIYSRVINSALQFRVADEGIGIEPQDMKHLTERFYRGSNAANIQGTGLGMHIVGKYVERLCGKMECESTPGKGTVFLIELPEGY